MQEKYLFVLQDSYPGEILVICYAKNVKDAAAKFGLTGCSRRGWCKNIYKVEVPKKEPSWWKNAGIEEGGLGACVRSLSPIQWYVSRVEPRMILK